MDIDALVRRKVQSFGSHCVTQRDSDSRAWVFTQGRPSPWFNGHPTFGSGSTGFRIHLVDPYHGRLPMLVDLETLTKNAHRQVGFRPSLILDSNALSYVNDFLNGNLTSADSREVVRQFLAAIFEREIDVTPVFYLLESLARANRERWRDRARDFAVSLFNLQSLNRELFLREGLAASSIEHRKSQLAFQGENRPEDLVNKYLDAIPANVADHEASNIDLSYAALLKIVLLRANDSSLADGLAVLGDFMVGELGAVLGLERFAALLHWSAPERFAKLITPLQPGVRPDRLFGKLQSTAWDLYLGRLPEQLGKFLPREGRHGGPPICYLFFVSTGEDALAELLRHRRIDLLIQMHRPQESSAVVGHTSGLLEILIPPDQLNEIARSSAEWEEKMAATSHSRVPISGQELKAVIGKLEQEVRAAASAQ